MDITKIAYEKYKLHWMLHHGYTIADLITELSFMQVEEPERSVTEWFDDWEFGFGFGSEIWVCYDEFMENEFNNSHFIYQLLTPDEFEEYVKYVVEKKMEVCHE